MIPVKPVPNVTPELHHHYLQSDHLIRGSLQIYAFNKLRKILAHDGIKIPEYEQIFNNVIGYDDVKLLLHKMITSKYTNSVLLTGPPASSKTVFILD